MSDRNTTNLSFRAIQGVRNYIEMRLKGDVNNNENVLFGRLGVAVSRRDLDECASLITEIRELQRMPVKVDNAAISDAADEYCEAIVDAPSDEEFYEACEWLRSGHEIDVIGYLLAEYAEEMENLRPFDD